MKLNWGHYILFTFLAFVFLILFMVYLSFEQENDLVAEDYYKRELDYQNVIDRRENSKALKETVMWELKNNLIFLQFPDLGVKPTGTISLMRPSDKSKDVSFAIDTNEELSQALSVSGLSMGKYLITVEWSVGNKSFYDEGTIFILK